MARGKRNIPALSLMDEIHRQGVIAMLTDPDAGALSDKIKEDFFNWLREEQPEVFAEQANDYALWKVEQKGEGDGKQK